MKTYSINPENFPVILAQYFATTNQGILILEASSTSFPIVYMNNGFHQLTQYTSDEVIGKNVEVIFGKFADELFLKKLNDVLLSHNSAQHEAKVFQKNGEYIDVIISITPVPTFLGDVEYVYLVLENISETKENIENSTKLKTVRLTLNSVNDIIFNYMNYLQLFYFNTKDLNQRIQNEELRELLREFNDEYRNIFYKLEGLNNLSNFKFKKLSDDLEIIENGR